MPSLLVHGSGNASGRASNDRLLKMEHAMWLGIALPLCSGGPTL